LYVDGTVVERFDDAAGPIPHRIVLAPMCAGTHHIDAVMQNTRGASASTFQDGDTADVNGQAVRGCLG